MRITNIEFPTEIHLRQGKVRTLKSDGLKDICIRGLGQVVLVAGANGSGKSRFLRRIEKLYHLDMEDIDGSRNQSLQDLIKDKQDKVKRLNNGLIGDRRYNLKQLKRDLAIAEEKGEKSKIKKINQNIKTLEQEVLQKEPAEKQQIADLEQSIQDHQKEKQHIKTNPRVSYDNFINNGLLSFSVESTDLSNPFEMTLQKIEQEGRKVSEVGLKHLHKATLPYIQLAQNLAWEANHPNYSGSEEQAERLKQEYLKLKDTTEKVLNLKLDRDNGKVTIGGMPISDKNVLSPGQSILLQLAVAVHAQEGKLDEMILLLDEPENHLHPDALIQNIDKVVELVPNGQVWIASHSVHLLSHCHRKHPSSLFFMEGGKIASADRKPEEALKKLFGGNEEEIGYMADFMNLPARYAAIHYTTRCLFAPDVAHASIGDPQNEQIIQNTKRSAGRPITAVDFGSGRGRLLVSLHDQYGQDITTEVNYIACDKLDTKNDEDSAIKQECIRTIQTAYPDESDVDSRRYFNDNSEGLKDQYKGTVDVIVMCNVLHELHPKNWIEIFQNDLEPLLKDDGYILIVEDHCIPVGEQAYDEGFLVLDNDALNKLFNTDQIELCPHPKEWEKDKPYYIDRLKAHRVNKSVLQNTTDTSIYNAIQATQIKALDEAGKLKKIDRSSENQSYKDGLKYSFWSQQHLTATLLKEQFKSSRVSDKQDISENTVIEDA